MEVFDKLCFLKEELEKAEKKMTFDLEERETLIDFFNSNAALWNYHFTEYRIAAFLKVCN